MILSEWFSMCRERIVALAKDIDVPMNRRAIDVWMPPGTIVYDLPAPPKFRLNADWYHGEYRYGFGIEWYPPSKDIRLSLDLVMDQSAKSNAPVPDWWPSVEFIAGRAEAELNWQKHMAYLNELEEMG